VLIINLSSLILTGIILVPSINISLFEQSTTFYLCAFSKIIEEYFILAIAKLLDFLNIAVLPFLNQITTYPCFFPPKPYKNSGGR